VADDAPAVVGSRFAAQPDWLRTFDFWTDASHHADPYPHYTELRERCPVARSDALGGYWLVTRYDDIRAVLQDGATFSSRYITVPDTPEPAGPRIPLQLDPPEHRHYRQLLLSLFSPATAEALAPTTRAIAARLLDTFVHAGGGDFVADVAARLPPELLLRWFGFPDEGVELLACLDETIRVGTRDPSRRDEVFAARAEADAYFQHIVDERAATGPTGEDVLSVLVTATVRGRALTIEERKRILMLLYSAGLHTTTNTLSNAVAHLAAHPTLRDRLTREPGRIPDALEELMRYESIVSVRRTPLRDVVVGGVQIAAGEPIMLFLGSAGRDEAVFQDPDVVDIDRPVKTHLNFGAGPHRCLGSHVARMELRVALEELHARAPAYRLDPRRSVTRHTGVERGVDELWLQA